jgi:hypothetical protein
LLREPPFEWPQHTPPSGKTATRAPRAAALEIPATMRSRFSAMVRPKDICTMPTRSRGAAAFVSALCARAQEKMSKRPANRSASFLQLFCGRMGLIGAAIVAGDLQAGNAGGAEMARDA